MLQQPGGKRAGGRACSNLASPELRAGTLREGEIVRHFMPEERAGWWMELVRRSRDLRITRRTVATSAIRENRLTDDASAEKKYSKPTVITLQTDLTECLLGCRQGRADEATVTPICRLAAPRRCGKNSSFHSFKGNCHSAFGSDCRPGHALLSKSRHAFRSCADYSAMAINS